MFHLINRVYVESMATLNHLSRRMTIGEEIGYEYVSLEPGVDDGEQLLYAVSLDELDKEKFESILRQEAASGKEKLTIFCDSDTYIRLYSMYIKSIFPNVDYDTFKWIMVCKKAMFASTMSSRGEPNTDVMSKLVINEKVVRAVFDANEPLQELINGLVNDNPEELSLEWQIIKLRLNGDVGKIPRVLKNILRKIAISNAHDALEVWGRYVTRPENWEMAGADIDTLLNATTVFEGCMNLPHLGATVLMRPGVYSFMPTDDWLEGMLKEAIMVMNHLEDESSARRASKILELLTDKRPKGSAEVTMDRVVTMFNGPMRIALAMRDNGKYDESLIRFILRLEEDKLRSLLEGAEWLWT